MSNARRTRRIVKPKQAKEAPQRTYEQRLFLGLSKGKTPPPTGPMLMSEQIFKPIVDICAFYLKYYDNSQHARAYVAFLAFHLRQQALKQFGHDTVETIALAKLIRPVDMTKPGRMDAVSHIMKYPNVAHRFDAEQQSAAEHIQGVWLAFGRGLQIGAKDWGRGMGSAGKLHEPVDGMSDDFWEHYKEYYVPWATKVSRINLQGSRLTVAALVFRVLVEDFYPEMLDKQYGMGDGESLKLLKIALTQYWQAQPIPVLG